MKKMFKFITIIIAIFFLIPQTVYCLRPPMVFSERKDVDLLLHAKVERIIEVNGSVAFSQDGKLAITGTFNGARFWYVATGRSIVTLPHKECFTCDKVAISRDGKMIIAADEEGDILIWDAEKKKRSVKLKAHQHAIGSVAFSLDGKKAITMGEKTVKIWDLVSKKAAIIKLKSKVFTFRNIIALSPHGNRAIIGYADGTARIYEVKTGKRILKLKGHKGEILAVNFSFDGKKVITGSHDCTSRIWDATSGKCLTVLSADSDTAISAVTFSSDGKMVATASWSDSAIRIWDARSGKNLAILQRPADVIKYLSFSQDGKKLFSSDWDTAIIWDLFNLTSTKSTNVEVLNYTNHRPIIERIYRYLGGFL